MYRKSSKLSKDLPRILSATDLGNTPAFPWVPFNHFSIELQLPDAIPRKFLGLNPKGAKQLFILGENS